MAPPLKPKPRLELTVLATSGEALALDGGFREPARLLAAWQTASGHCLDGGCNTIAVSAGGHIGPGRPVAPLLASMGYSASAISNGDLSQGRAAVEAGVAGLTHLAANLRDGGLALPGILPVERSGLTLQLVGLTWDGAGGIQATSAQEHLWTKGTPWRADRPMIVITDVCIHELARLLEITKQWPYMGLAIGRRCGSTEASLRVKTALVMATGEGFGQYGRAVLTYDRNSAALLHARAELVTLDGGPTDAELDAVIAARGWR